MQSILFELYSDNRSRNKKVPTQATVSERYPRHQGGTILLRHRYYTLEADQERNKMTELYEEHRHALLM